jgi:peroxiredoxin
MWQTLLSVLTLLLWVSDAPQSDLIQQVSDNYHSLSSFEIAGHLTATISGTELQMRVGADDAYAGKEVMRLTAASVTDAKGNPASPAGLNVVMPHHWGYYGKISADIKSAKELPAETIDVGGALTECRVLEVVYDRERWRPEESTLKYWVDAKRLLVLKEEFAEFSGQHQNSVLWHWVYKVDSVKLNEAPPEWLVEHSMKPASDPQPRTEWVGRSAPDFELPDIDGHSIRLSSLRGKVVVLDFWATWCGPCKEEMPTLEKVSADYKAKRVMVLSISDDRPSAVRKWMTNNPLNLPTLFDSERKTAEQFDVGGIPAIIVIGGDGKVVSYYTGTQSEKSLDSAVDKALMQE